MLVVGLEYGEAFNDGLPPPSLSTFAKRTIITNSRSHENTGAKITCISCTHDSSAEVGRYDKDLPCPHTHT